MTSYSSNSTFPIYNFPFTELNRASQREKNTATTDLWEDGKKIAELSDELSSKGNSRKT